MLSLKRILACCSSEGCQHRRLAEQRQPRSRWDVGSYPAPLGIRVASAMPDKWMQLGSCHILHSAFGENLVNTWFQQCLVQSHVRKPVAEPGAESRSAESCPVPRPRGSWCPPHKEPFASVSWALGCRSLCSPPFFFSCLYLHSVSSLHFLPPSLSPPIPSTPLNVFFSIRVVAPTESGWPRSGEGLKHVERLRPQLPAQRFLRSSAPKNASQLTPALRGALQQRRRRRKMLLLQPRHKAGGRRDPCPSPAAHISGGFRS